MLYVGWFNEMREVQLTIRRGDLLALVRPVAEQLFLFVEQATLVAEERLVRGAALERSRERHRQPPGWVHLAEDHIGDSCC